MWMIWLLGLLLVSPPASADPGFDSKYERDYNIFNPLNQYRPDNPLNPINAYDPKNPLKIDASRSVKRTPKNGT